MTRRPDVPGGARRFRVALSFPGSHRDYVSVVAADLARRFGQDRVLFDEFHQAEFARPRLATHLPPLYFDESDLIVAFIGKDYARRDWCGVEWDAILALIKAREPERVMLFRTDSGPVEGLYGLEGAIEIDRTKPGDAARLVVQRLARNDGQERDTYLVSGGDRPADQSRSGPARTEPAELALSILTCAAMVSAITLGLIHLVFYRQYTAEAIFRIELLCFGALVLGLIRLDGMRRARANKQAG